MQKTAYELRISDWSSDVCSSDLLFLPLPRPVADSRQDRAAAAAADEHQQAGPEGRRRPARPRGRERGKVVMRKSFVAETAASSTEERRVGHECVRTRRFRRSTYR